MRWSGHCISGRRHGGAFSEKLQKDKFNEIGPNFPTPTMQDIRGIAEQCKVTEECPSMWYDIKYR